MTPTINMTVPQNWPYPVVPPGLASQSYPISPSGQISAHAQDVSALLDLGFTIGGPNQPQGVSVALSSAQILTLFSKPVLLVPAQGPNTVIIPQLIMLTGSSGAAYTLGNNIFLYYGTNLENSFSLPSTDPLVTNAGQSFACQVAFGSSFNKSTTPTTSNLPLYLGADVSDPTGGTKSATFAITYSVFPIATPA
jgi:hypothetical protein